jgi:hypothetical protein
MAETLDNLQFYKNSLRKAEDELKDELKDESNKKALKDIVGKVYEKHRARVWEHFGFSVSKDKNVASFNVDLLIKWKDKPEPIGLEETKGHYLDSCFMERAITGFCKTINRYKKEGKPIPRLIIHSFTRYNLFIQNLQEDLDTRKPEIADVVNDKIVYTTLVDSDRIPAKKWFSEKLNIYNAYTAYASDELILKDIEFIQSLIPVSE